MTNWAGPFVCSDCNELRALINMDEMPIAEAIVTLKAPANDKPSVTTGDAS